MAHDALLARAANPERVKILGKKLMPYTLGHELLLRQNGSQFIDLLPEDFFQLPLRLQILIQKKIDEMGFRLDTFQHYRMTGSENFRLRVGDVRVIYRFDLAKAELYLVAMGHRREIYRD